MSQRISFFSNGKEVTPQERGLTDVFMDIQAGMYEPEIRCCRELLSAEGKEAYKKYRTGNVPHFASHTVQVTRAKGNDDRIIEFTGLCQIDFDGLSDDEMIKVRTKAKNDPHVVMCYTSPSEKGIKILLRVPEATDRTHYLVIASAAERYCSKTFGIPPESATLKDLMRLCALSSDPDAYYNESAEPIAVTVPEGTRHNTIRTIVASCVGRGMDNIAILREVRTQVPDLDINDEEIQSLIDWCQAQQGSQPGTSPDKKRAEVPEAIPLLSLRTQPPEPHQTLLGKRLLCREGGMIFVGPSGVGKSSAAVQQDVCWSVGKPAFGIMPARPLKILQIQAENDRGDLHEMITGVWNAMRFGMEEETLCTANLLVASEKSRTGRRFLLEVVRPLLDAHRPDIIRIDPLLAYLGDDPTDTKALMAFCRSGLNPLLEEFGCAVILNHHTPKTTNRDTSKWRAADWMYSGAGGADLANWARAILVIEPTDNPDAFRFIGAKRGTRLGWFDQSGNRQFQRIYCHSGDTIAWREATDSECESVRAKKDKGMPTDSDLIAFVPEQGAINKEALLALWNQAGIGQTKCKGRIAALLAGGKLFEWEVKRSGTRPKLQISRQQQGVA